MENVLINIKNKIFLNAQKEYDKEWLKYYSLEVGDIVKARFNSKSGTSKRSYHSHTICDAEIVLDVDGTLKLKSKKPIKQSKCVSNGRSGRSYRDWWEFYSEIRLTNIESMLKKEED